MVSRALCSAGYDSNEKVSISKIALTAQLKCLVVATLCSLGRCRFIDAVSFFIAVHHRFYRCSVSVPFFIVDHSLRL